MSYKISVVTICYNSEKYIENTILSVINQTYPNIEYIIIDGDSKDKTVEIIKQYGDKIDIVVSEPDKGIYDAMNKGLDKSTGDFIVFMNSGDAFYNNTVIERFVSKIDNDTIIAHGNIMVVGSEFKYLSKPYPIEMMDKRMTVKHQASFIRTDYHKSHPYDTRFRSSGDYDFFHKAYFKNKVKFQYIPLCVANFDNSGTSNVNFRRSFRENRIIWKKENDFVFCFKQEINFVIWDIKRWIKKHLMSKSAQVKYTKKQAANYGTVYNLDEKIDNI